MFREVIGTCLGDAVEGIWEVVVQAIVRKHVRTTYEHVYVYKYAYVCVYIYIYIHMMRTYIYIYICY